MLNAFEDVKVQMEIVLLKRCDLGMSEVRLEGHFFKMNVLEYCKCKSVSMTTSSFTEFRCAKL